MKRVFTLIIAISIVAMSFQIAFAESKVNVALNKPVTVSGEPHGIDYGGQNITDGTTSTLWSSNSGTPVWAIIDLEKWYKIDSVTIAPRMELDQAGSRGNITVELSNDADFSGNVYTVGTIGAVAHKELKSLSVKTDNPYRYVRVRPSDNKSYKCISEVYVYGTVAKTDKVSMIEFTDVADTELLDRLNLLNALGCLKFNIPNGNFEQDNLITRAEFYSIFINAVYGYSGASGNIIFKDVDEENFAVSEIGMAADLGYVAKTNKFNPTENVNKNEAYKAIAKALKLVDVAEAKGGSLYSYFEILNRKGILKYVDNENTYLTRADAVNMIFNMINTTTNIITNVRGEYVEYKDAGPTILSDVHEIGYSEGIFSANEYTDLNFNSKTPLNMIAIDGTQYYLAEGFKIDNEKLGQKIGVYFRDSKEIISIKSIKKQDILRFTDEEISGFDNNCYLVYSGKRTVKYKLKYGYDIIYNGIAVPTLDASLFVPLNGWITIIDYDNDGGYDAVNIVNYENNIVETVNTSNSTLTLRYGNNKYIDLSADDVSYAIYKDGKLGTIKDISIGTILSIGYSTDEKHFEIYACDDLFEGTIKSYDDKTVTIAGFEEVGNLNISKHLLNDKIPNVDYYVVAYLNSFGDVAYFSIDDGNNIKYAYVYGVGLPDNSKIDEKIMLKLFNSSGTGVYSISDKVYIDGVPYKNISDITLQIVNKLCDSNGELKSQMIKYRANSSLEIKELYTISGSPNIPSDVNKDNGIYQRLDEELKKTYYVEDILGGKYPCDENTMFLDVGYNDDGYEFNMLLLKDIKDRITCTHAFGKNDPLSPLEILVLDRSESTEISASDYKYVMYDDYSKIIDEFGSEQYSISGYYQGQKQEFITSRTSVFSNILSQLKRGMVIRLAFDYNDKLVEVKVMYHSKNDVVTDDYLASENLIKDADKLILGSWIYNDDLMVYGYFSSLKGDYAQFMRGTYSYILSDRTVHGVTYYCSETDKIYPISFNSIKAENIFPSEYYFGVLKYRHGQVIDAFLYDCE